MSVAGQTLTVTANSSTRMENKVTGNPLSLTDLADVDTQFLRVRGIDDGNNGVIASRIRIESPNDEILQGVIQLSTATSMGILGIDIAVDETIQRATGFSKIDNTFYTGFCGISCRCHEWPDVG